MSDTSNPALGLSRALLKVLIVLNVALGAFFFVLLVASYVFEDAFVTYYRTEMSGVDAGLLIPTLRVMVLIGAPMFAAVHVILSRSLEIVETVRHGQPFVAENAIRLKAIAWALLLVQILHLAFGVAVKVANAAKAPMAWDFSIAGCLAVLLLFVLARVFEEGARMRNDLEAMI